MTRAAVDEVSDKEVDLLIDILSLDSFYFEQERPVSDAIMALGQGAPLEYVEPRVFFVQWRQVLCPQQDVGVVVDRAGQAVPKSSLDARYRK